MEFFKPNNKINFAGKFRFFGYMSLTLVVLSLILFLFKGLNYGVDFKGGTEIQLKIDGTNINEMRTSLSDIGKIEIQQFDNRNDQYLLRLSSVSLVKKKDIKSYIDDVEKTISDSKIIKSHYDSEVGDRIELTFDKEINSDTLASIIKKYPIPATGEIEYKKIGDRHVYRIILEGTSTKVLNELKNKLNKTAEIERVELVGPKVGKQLRVDAFLSVLYALIGILVYIAFRFNYQFAPGAVVALAHDVLITLGIFSLFGISFDLTIVAALLTIVGYSLNDTIVIYDRIRENLGNIKKGKEITENINTSINETVSRTILTSVTTLFVLFALLFLGGQTIRGFALAMTIGVFVGTYSSIFVASPITILIDKYMAKRSKGTK